MQVKIHKCCNQIPEYVHGQATEDTVEGFFRCNVCGKCGDPAEHVWGGEELLILAADCWNELFEK